MSYARFLAAQSPPGADPDAAAVRLTAFIDKEITAAPARGESTPHSVPGPRPTPLLLRLRPALAIAAGIVLVGTAVVWLRPGVPDQPVLRGVDSGIDTALPLALYDPFPSADGSVRLSWRPLAEADRYEVRIYAADLRELLRLEPLADTVRVLHRSDLPPGAAAETLALWRVAALQEGDEIALSRPGTLRLP